MNPSAVAPRQLGVRNWFGPWDINLYSLFIVFGFCLFFLLELASNLSLRVFPTLSSILITTGHPGLLWDCRNSQGSGHTGLTNTPAEERGRGAVPGGRYTHRFPAAVAPTDPEERTAFLIHLLANWVPAENNVYIEPA